VAQPTQNFGNRSVAAMRTQVYAGLKRSPDDPVSGIGASYLNHHIAVWDAYFCDYTKWTFRRTSKVIENWGRTVLHSALATTDLYAELSSNANIPSSGRFLINGDEIDYSAKDDPTAGKSVTISTAAGAKTPDVSHVAGEEVNFLVTAPADFGKPGELWRGNSANPFGQKLTHLDYREWSYAPAGHYFYNDGYFYLPRGIPTGRLYAVYYKKAMKLGENDHLQTPEKFDRFVYLCAMAECYKVLGDDDKANTLFLEAGVPTPSNADPVGILQVYAADDAEQTDSLDDIFIPRL
jgi:hypothetical protein